MKRYHYTQLHLGVQVRIVLYAEKEDLGNKAATAAFERIKTLEEVFSDYRPRSEIRQLALLAVDSTISVSEPLFTVLQHARALSIETAGAFDITVGPYVALWRTARKTGQLPHSDSLTLASRRVGYDLVQLDVQTGSVRLPDAGIQLDVGGLAKGYILDEALAILNQNGFSSALIEAGGDIVVSAAPPGEEGWRVDIPGISKTDPVAIAARNLSFAAIATSGDTEQFVEIDGTRYSHVVDPRTGQALTNRRSATVIAPSGLLADGYATALTVMSEEEAAPIIQNNPEIFVYTRHSGHQTPDSRP